MGEDFAHEPHPAQDAAAAFGRDEILNLAQEAGQWGIFEWNVESNRVTASEKLLSIYGLKEFGQTYEQWLACLFQEDVPRVRDSLDQSFAARERDFVIEFRIGRRNDQALRWIEMRNVALYSDQGHPRHIIGIQADITERKRSLLQLRAFAETLEDRVRERTRQLEAENEARLQAEALLRQAQKMEAVGQLTGGIAHDFNNLLTVIFGGLDTIARFVPQLPPTAAAARIGRARDMALQGAQRAAALTQRLLAFSRQQALAPTPIDANKLVSGMAEFLHRALGESVELETVLAAGLWRTYADSHQLENAVLNLALNARDATPNGGKVTIETANCYLDESYVSGMSEPVDPGQYVMIAVSDTGSGMDKATAARAFDPFFTTKEVGKGTGLGLSQVYGFVRQSAGNVRIYSEPGEGTTVKVYLPRYVGQDSPSDHKTQVGESLRATGLEHILVVEDDAALRTYTVEVLEELGYCVHHAATGAAALEILHREPAVQLLFTDVVMPGGMTGRQLADEALKRKPQLKVLFTTGYTRNAIVHQQRLDPGIALIGKPFTSTELAAKIRGILDAPTG